MLSTLGGCVMQPIAQQPVGDGTDTGTGQSSPAPSGQSIFIEGGTRIGTLPTERPAVFAVLGDGDLLTGQLNDYSLQCRVVDPDGIRFVSADLSACGGPADAALVADPGTDTYRWTGTLVPQQTGLARCTLAATSGTGKVTRLNLLIGVFGSGGVAPEVFAATGFLTLVIEPTTDRGADSNIDLTLNSAALVNNAPLAFPGGFQRTLELTRGDNRLDIRGRSFINTWRVRFLEGVALKSVFDALLILPRNQAASFTIKFTPGQRLQDVTVSRSPAKIRLRDYALQDGDRIDLFLNDQPLLTNHTILNAGATIDAPLRSGANVLRIRALNVGSSSPNTAAISFTDVVSGPAEQTWGLYTGDEALLTIRAN